MEDTTKFLLLFIGAFILIFSYANLTMAKTTGSKTEIRACKAGVLIGCYCIVIALK